MTQDKVTVTQADREFYQELCFSFSQQFEADTLGLIARHRLAAQAEIEVLRVWRDAVDDALVQHMTTAGSFPDARSAVRWLIEREQHMALDPAISADARKLVDAETEALRKVVEQAAEWFEDYADQHAEKASQAVDSYEQAARRDKSARNAERASVLRATLGAKQ